MLLSQGSSKKRKQGDRIFRFKTFCSPGHPIHFNGSFQENVRALLEFGNREADSHGGSRRWSFQLELHRHPPMHISLYVMEEIVENSQHRHCHHCKFIGWGHHVICNRRLHFVLPSKKPMLRDDDQLSYGCDVKGVTVATARSKSMNLQGQLMHGVMHSNGFGHLLTVNGIGGGSEIVSGHLILDLWDRICAGLQLRKVSLTDTARKGTMSLRLIHGVAYGEPWFGTWGYRFGRGSFGVTQQIYHKSIEALQSLPLCLLVPHYAILRHEIPAIVARYQTISGNSLLTLGHLFHFMLELKRRLPPDTLMAMDYHGIATEPACRWSMKRVEMAAQVIVDSLKKAGHRWVPRQDVRDSARIYIGDTGLLDFVLKSIGNHVVGSYMVRRMVNPVTKVLEYCLEDISHAFPDQEHGLGLNHLRAKSQLITKVQLMRDLFYLYKYILKEQNPAITTGIFSSIPMAVRIVLDTKQLVKDYGGGIARNKVEQTQGERSAAIKLLCSIHFSNGVEPTPPCELVTVPAHATIGDVKMIAEAHFKETYLGLRSFVAETVMDVHGRDSDLVLGIVEPGGNINISGRIEGVGDGRQIYESGCNDRVVVDCHCGAKEDDGERMVCCDVCDVWQHTRCLQIPSSEEMPRVFLCRCCERDIASMPSLLS